MNKCVRLLYLSQSFPSFFIRRTIRGKVISNVTPIYNEESTYIETQKLIAQGLNKHHDLKTNEKDWLTIRTKKLQQEKQIKTISKIPEKITKQNEIIDDIKAENQYEKLHKVVTPFGTLDYQIQLSIKYKKCFKILKNLAQTLKSQKVYLPIDKMGIPCVLEFTRPSPMIERYQNKNEFGIRHDINGQKTVGLYVGSSSKGKVFCVEPRYLINIKLEHIKVAKLFQKYVQESPYDACTDFKVGHWRNLIVRSNTNGDIMAILVMHPQQLSKDELNAEKLKIKEYFTTGPGSVLDLKSLYFQACPHTRCTHAQAPFELLHGEPYIFENIDELKLRVSPETFLQGNPSAARVLYDTIKCFANISSDTTVLDVCSGAGAISLSMAKDASRTIGIELSSQAVEDAKYNAELNGIHNVTFFQGRAEKLLPEIVPNLQCSELVAIVNPARSGLEPSVIKALRECKYLKRIVYISCKPEGNAFKNFMKLCTPANKTYRHGTPFVPIYAIPVDLFPQTDHCELVLIFERV